MARCPLRASLLVVYHSKAMLSAYRGSTLEFEIWTFDFWLFTSSNMNALTKWKVNAPMMHVNKPKKRWKVERLTFDFYFGINMNSALDRLWAAWTYLTHLVSPAKC